VTAVETPASPKPGDRQAAKLVPPRPNPGPLPYDQPWPAWLGPAGLPLAAVLALAAVAMLRARSRSRRPRTSPTDGPANATAGANGEPTGVLALAGQVREALVRRFGDAWRAKTTEEVAADLAKAPGIDPETRARVADLLLAADRLKFAGGEADPASQTPPTDWVANFVHVSAGSKPGKIKPSADNADERRQWNDRE